MRNPGGFYGASREGVVRAYRRLALRFHPDVQPPERKQWAVFTVVLFKTVPLRR